MVNNWDVTSSSSDHHWARRFAQSDDLVFGVDFQLVVRIYYALGEVATALSSSAIGHVIVVCRLSLTDVWTLLHWPDESSPPSPCLSFIIQQLLVPYQLLL